MICAIILVALPQNQAINISLGFLQALLYLPLLLFCFYYQFTAGILWSFSYMYMFYKLNVKCLYLLYVTFFPTKDKDIGLGAKILMMKNMIFVAFCLHSLISQQSH